MDWLLSLIPGGQLTVILGAAGAALLALWRILAGIKQSGVDKQKAKEAEAREKNLDRIKRAADARPTGGVSDDPNNRDKR
jgi:hypothetical protein